MNKKTSTKNYMDSLFWTPLKEGQTESDIEVKHTLGQAKSLAENSFKSGWDARCIGLVDYIYEFAWHYGRLYHIGDAEKIKAAISEKFMLPEEFVLEAQAKTNTNDMQSNDEPSAP